jgi:uncharacterized SAM-binding protein YcdF (DUF218 family)
MYWLSKLLPLLLLPFGLALALLLAAVLSGRRWPSLLALLLLLIASLPLTAELLWRWLERPWQRRPAAALPSASAIVVLGGGRHPAPGPGRRSEWVDADRFFGGIELFQAGRAPQLIFTGGWSPSTPQAPPEGEVLRRQAIALGLPAAALRSTVRVTNTAEEASAVAALLPSRAPVILVTSAFHMKRAQRLFERRGLRVIPYPVDFQARGAWAGHPLADPLHYVPSASGLDSTSRALREALGRTLYRAW